MAELRSFRIGFAFDADCAAGACAVDLHRTAPVVG